MLDMFWHLIPNQNAVRSEGPTEKSVDLQVTYPNYYYLGDLQEHELSNNNL